MLQIETFKYRSQQGIALLSVRFVGCWRAVIVNECIVALDGGLHLTDQKVHLHALSARYKDKAF